MAKIINRSMYSLSVLTNEYTAFIPPPDKRGGEHQTSKDDIPEDVAKEWAKKPGPAAMIAKGIVSVELSGDAASETTEVDSEDLSAMNWQKVIKLVAEEDDLDALAELHATEKRASVLKAVEARMVELRA